MEVPGITDLMIAPETIAATDFPNTDASDFENLELIPFDDPRLYVEPPEFDFAVEGTYRANKLAETLLERMFAWKGVGLSANQLGLPHKVFAMGTRETSLVLFNPSVKAVSKETTKFREGCLSFPGLTLVLERPKTCVIAYQDTAGNHVVQQFPGLACRIALHEYDHMNGLTFTAHASQFKIKWELDKLRKAAKKAATHQATLQRRNAIATNTRKS
jgi:peptide deformylase